MSRDDGRRVASGGRGRTFDVICAGDTRVSIGGGAAAPLHGGRAPGSDLHFRAGGGPISAAIALSAQRFRVALATVLADDTAGRALLADCQARGIDASGVEIATPRAGLLLVRGGARQVVPVGEEEQPVSVPDHWSAEVLLLSGMSPKVSHGAALCKAARWARRSGARVMVDVNLPWHLWKGQDPRMLRMVLREADVVSCSAHDLFGIGLDVPGIRAALRPGAVLVWLDEVGTAVAAGPFGEVVHPLRGGPTPQAGPRSEAIAAAICSEMLQAGAREAGAGADAFWSRVLHRVHATMADSRG